MNMRGNNFLNDDSGCLSMETLLRYQEGRLTAEEKYRAEKHLIDCPLCSDALEGLHRNAEPMVARVRSDVAALATARRGETKRYLLAAASIGGILLLLVAVYEFALKTPQENIAQAELETGKIQDLSSIPPVPEKKAAALIDDSSLKSETVPMTRKINSKQGSSSMQMQAALTDSIPASEDSRFTEAPGAEKVAVTTGNVIQASPSEPVAVKMNADLAQEERAAGQVTYIDNRKVVQPAAVQKKEYQEADRPRDAVTQKDVTALAESVHEDEAEYKQTVRSQYMLALEDAIVLYNSGRYDSALRSFNSMLKQHPDDANALFYRGLCWYQLGKYQESSNALRGFMQSESDPFFQEARFYYALSLRHTRQQDAGEKLLRKIAGEAGPFQEKARKELATGH